MNEQTPREVQPQTPVEEKKSNAGRPPIWTDPIELKELIFEYFTSGKGKERPTLAGLARALKIDRQTLYNYAKKDEFFDIIKEARQRVEEAYEDRLLYESTPTGVIFALKNMGWSDNQKVDHTTQGEKLSGFNYQSPQQLNEPDNSNN